jgi:hypothetical protein
MYTAESRISKWIFNFRFLVFVFLLAGFAQSVVAQQEAKETILARPSEGLQPETVWFLFYVMDIQTIDGPGQNFSGNVYVRLRWKDERLADDKNSTRVMPLSKIWHPPVLLANQHGLVRTSLPEVAQVKSDGTVMYRQRYVGTLSQPLHLSEFPFDSHKFTIQFASVRYSAEELVFMPDRVDDGKKQIVGGLMAGTLSLPDWKILRYTAEPRPHIITDEIQTPGFALVFTAKRHLNYYFWQTMMPLVLIVMMSWGPFWIDPSLSGTQISLAASSMLTTIAYRFLLANLLPKLPYMTRMDYLTLFSTVLVFVALVEVIITSSLSHANHNQLAQRIDRGSRVVFPILFVLALCWSFFA